MEIVIWLNREILLTTENDEVLLVMAGKWPTAYSGSRKISSKRVWAMVFKPVWLVGFVF